jgi:hypothetical protein
MKRKTNAAAQFISGDREPTRDQNEAYYLIKVKKVYKTTKQAMNGTS